MAKDGTKRGGYRIGSGRKAKSAAQKKLEGKDVKTLNLGTYTELEGKEMPPVEEYMKANQKAGIELTAQQIFKEMWDFLVLYKCEKCVGVQLIREYAMSVARWVQCETAVNQFGFLAKHPTTGAPIQSPYVTMSHDYLKDARQSWYQIYAIIKANSTCDYSPELANDPMEMMLRQRGL